MSLVCRGCDREKGVNTSGWVAPSQTLRRCSLFSRYPGRFTNVKMQLHILLVIVLRKQILSCVAFVSRLTAEGVCVQKGVQAKLVPWCLQGLLPGPLTNP